MASGQKINFMVKYGISRKLVSVDALFEVVSAIQEAFSKVKNFPKSFCVQFRHKDFGEYIDLDQTIQLLERADNTLIVYGVDQNGSESDDSSESNKTWPVEDDFENGDLNDQKHEENQATEETEEQNEDDEIEQNEDDLLDNSRVTVAKWPIVFVIDEPAISSIVLQRLNGKKLLNETERGLLFAAIYDQCYTKYNNIYPTSSQYSQILNAIFQRWPHLVKELKNDDDTKILWRHRIRNFYKSSRRRTPNLPEIRCRKRRIINENERPVVSPKRLMLSWGVANYLPDPIDGEDETTTATHCAKLQKEAKVVAYKRNLALIDSIMEITFPQRRKMIVTDMARLKDVIEKYPVLTEKDELFKEFQRLSKWNVYEKLCEGLAKNRDKINLQKPSTDKNKLQDLRSEVAMSRNELNRIYTTNCLAIFTVPFLLREDPLSFFDVNNENRQPRIRCQFDISNTTEFTKLINAEKFEVVVEDKVISVTNNFIQAFALFFAAHYVFNVNYSNQILATMTFLQKYILNLPDNCSVSPKILNLISKLRKL